MNKSIISALILVLVLVGVVVLVNKAPATPATNDNNVENNVATNDNNVENNVATNGGSDNQTTKATTCVVQPSGLVGIANTKALGNYLTDAKCMTLYTTSNDASQKSNCYDNCAEMWPPFINTGIDIKGNNDGINNFERNDGTVQFGIGDKPLYYYQGDANAGDTTGNGVGGVWSVVPQQ